MDFFPDTRVQKLRETNHSLKHHSKCRNKDPLHILSNYCLKKMFTVLPRMLLSK